jgi:hypothetical protein
LTIGFAIIPIGHEPLASCYRLDSAYHIRACLTIPQKNKRVRQQKKTAKRRTDCFSPFFDYSSHENNDNIVDY